MKNTAPKLLLLIVAYHPSESEVNTLSASLDNLPEHIAYAVIANDFRHGECIEKLANNAYMFLRNGQNIGYGRAINLLFKKLPTVPEYIGILNSDLSWNSGTFSRIINFMESNTDVSLLTPKIISPSGNTQYLCKQHPTILGMVSRRFIPNLIKPRWLCLYDRWYTMSHQDYESIFDVPYLSGCCMVARSTSFILSGGFDESFFLYLEDADLTRSLSLTGRCIHYPFESVIHQWGRGNYKNFFLMLVNLYSAYIYFKKWGLRLW